MSKGEQKYTNEQNFLEYKLNTWRLKDKRYSFSSKIDQLICMECYSRKSNFPDAYLKKTNKQESCYI